MGVARQQTRQPTRRNGNLNEAPVKLEPSGDAITDAIREEQALAEEAAQIRGDAKELTAELFAQLYPLLRRPIPTGFILEVTAGKGKPYDSVGVRSVQVLIDRMDNVLTPMWWWDECRHEDDGKLAHVKVHVGPRDASLFSRESHGGVDRGSTVGNLYKGSYTNAAKLAFARVGPGHEIYLGAADYDPDTNAQAAEAQAEADGGGAETPIGKERAEKLTQIVAEAGLADHLQNKLRALGIKALADATEAQGMAVYEWCGASGEGVKADG